MACLGWHWTHAGSDKKLKSLGTQIVLCGPNDSDIVCHGNRWMMQVYILSTLEDRHRSIGV